MKYTNCLDCSYHCTNEDDQDMMKKQKYIVIYQIDMQGVTKTQWLENGYSYINTPSDYPLGDINKINEN